MNDRDILDCLVFGLSRGFVPARRRSHPRLEEVFPQSAERTEPAKTSGILARLWQMLKKRRPKARLAHRLLPHCG